MKQKILEIIADQIGVEVEDINLEDDLREDLHMTAVDLSELTEIFAEQNFGSVDFSEIETVEELFESLGVDDEI